MSARRRAMLPLVLALLALPLAGCTRSDPQARRVDEVSGRRIVWGRRIEIASGPAVRGPWRMNESDFRWVDDPAVELAVDGDAVVAWVDQERKDLFFQRYGADGRVRLDQPVNVSRTPETFSWLPRIAVDGRDPNRVFLLWQEIVFSGGTHGGEVLFARSSDGGRTFGAPANLSASKAGDGKGRLDAKTWDNGSLDLARGPAPEGVLYAVWTEYEGTLWLRRSLDDGATWLDLTRLAGEATAPARAPAIAATRGGVVWAVWTVGDDPHADVHVARSADGGQSFAAVATLGEPAGHSDAPQLAVDDEGTVHVVYSESPSGRGGPRTVRYARSKRGTGQFERPREIASSGSAPTVSVDARGRVYILWEGEAGGGARQGLGFACSLDGGEHIAAPSDAIPGVAGRDLGANGSQQGQLADKLAVAREGGMIAIVNSTFEAGRASRVRLVRGRLVD